MNAPVDNWPTGNWLGLAVLCFVFSVTFLVIVIGEQFRGWRFQARPGYWYWGPDDPDV